MEYELRKPEGIAHTESPFSQPSVKRNVSRRQPRPARNKILHAEPGRLTCTADNSVPTPSNSPTGRRTRSRVLILTIIQRLQRKLAIPLEPTGRVNNRLHIRLKKNGPRVFLPRPAQESLERTQNRFKIIGRHDPRVVDRNSGVLVRVGPALGRYGDLLLVHRFSCVYHAVLEDNGGVSEDEIDGSVDVTFLVELSLGVGVEGVLVAFEAAAVEDGKIGAGAKRHGLVVRRAGGVAECYSLCYKPIPGHRCKVEGGGAAADAPAAGDVSISHSITNKHYVLQFLSNVKVFIVNAAFYMYNKSPAPAPLTCSIKGVFDGLVVPGAVLSHHDVRLNGGRLEQLPVCLGAEPLLLRAKVFPINCETLLLAMSGKTFLEFPSSTNPVRHVSRLVNAVLSHVWASNWVHFVSNVWLSCNIVSSYSLTQSAHAAVSRSFRHRGPSRFVYVSAWTAVSRAISVAIFLNSDLRLGAVKWRRLWVRKYLHWSGCGVWLHHRFTSPAPAPVGGLTDRDREMKEEKEANMRKKFSLDISKFRDFLWLVEVLMFGVI
nr:hypothetical protein BHE74_00043207 [Ipomoea trifida]